ncbi:hypothetical protein ACU4GG_18500 [Streptomyces nojiriensis]
MRPNRLDSTDIDQQHRYHPVSPLDRHAVLAEGLGHARPYGIPAT